MMLPVLKLFLIAGLLFFTFGCGQSNKEDRVVETKQVYSLCPITADARERMYYHVSRIVDQQQALITDRSSEAQKELSDIKSGVLKSTGGEPILLTVEKPGEFRISVTNLGLVEKIAMSVSWWGESRKTTPVDDLMLDLAQFWVIEEVDGVVTDDPPCNRFAGNSGDRGIPVTGALSPK